MNPKNEQLGRAQLAKLDDAAKAARAVATELFGSSIVGACRDEARCLEREAARKLDNVRTRKRGFGEYDPKRLCGPCRAYWFAEMLAQTLEQENHFARMIEAEREPQTIPGPEDVQS